jgi:hypothetical protein
MRLLTNLLCKVTLSSMILTAPAMITGNTSYNAGSSFLRPREGSIPFFTSTVIRRFVDHPTVIAMRAFPRETAAAPSFAVTSVVTSAVTSAASSAAAGLDNSTVANAGAAVAVTAKGNNAPMERSANAKPTTIVADAKSAELRVVIRQATLIYTAMDLQDYGLDPKAFEYAWRGYHNLLKKGVIRKRTVLSICDFSQSSRSKRMYVIDVQHRKLLYRTYVAHGQNSGDEYASDFSNDPDSYKSSLGFYVTQKTYIGRNGLSLRLNGVDPGYNDMAFKRQIVLHGSSYVGEKYMQDYGNLGTSLGCPALPVEVSGRIIRAVKNGSCLFIYHPTQQYLENSAILHG